MRRIPLPRHGVALLRSLTLITLHGVVCAVAAAQCRPPKNSNEAKLLAFYGMPIVFSADPTSVAAPTSAPTLRLSMEGAYVPSPPASIQRADNCYTGHVENTSLAKFFGRPRLSVTFANGLGAEVSYLPPVKIADAKPDLFSAAAWLTRSVTGDIHMTGRVNMTRGSVHGPITCPKSGLQQTDAQAPCYGTNESDDEFRPDMYGGELIASFVPSSTTARFGVQAGVGVNLLRPRFAVDFSDLLGGRDRTRIEVNLTRVTGLLGATMRLTQRCQVATQGYTSFGDGATVRAYLGCALLSRHDHDRR